MAENQTAYNTWKEGGIGRSLLHAGTGGLLTGNIGGALGAGGTSLAAPYLDKAAKNLGSAGKAVIDTVGGAAIGWAAGGHAGAAAGANTDWFNRQLHQSERQLIKKHAEAMQAHVKKVEGKDISLAEAELRLEKQILRWVDKASDDGYTDQTAVSFLGISGKSGDTRWDYRDYAIRYPSEYADTNLFAEYLSPDRKAQLQNLRSGRPNAQIQAEARKNEELAMELVSNLPGSRAIKPAIKSWVDWLKGRKPNSSSYMADPVLVGMNGLQTPSNIGSKSNLPDNVSASVNNSKNYTPQNHTDIAKKKVNSASVGDTVRTPTSHPNDFTKMKGSQDYKNKYTGEIWSKSNSQHSDKSVEWKVGIGKKEPTAKHKITIGISNGKIIKIEK